VISSSSNCKKASSEEYGSGISSKLLNPDFETLINNYDILVLVETKTDEYDNIKLPNEYACYVKHRKLFIKKSGGIIIIYKKILSNFLKFIQSDSEFVQCNTGFIVRTTIYKNLVIYQ
jgi:hypothetical protein